MALLEKIATGVTGRNYQTSLEAVCIEVLDGVL